jgi:predicted HTH domain antitoxin
MSSIKIELPESLGIEPQDFLLAAASKLYETGKISSGQGASIVGVSKRTFLELLEVYGVSLFNISESDLDDDVKNAGNYARQNL